nr:MAG TPA: hypothetical protein [Caudoviricetes sp.]
MELETIVNPSGRDIVPKIELSKAPFSAKGFTSFLNDVKY